MLAIFRAFFRKDDGAVTVDWVVLTAAVVLLAGVTVTAMITGTDSLGSNLGDYLTDMEVTD